MKGNRYLYPATKLLGGRRQGLLRPGLLDFLLVEIEQPSPGVFPVLVFLDGTAGEIEDVLPDGDPKSMLQVRLQPGVIVLPADALSHVVEKALLTVEKDVPENGEVPSPVIRNLNADVNGFGFVLLVLNGHVKRLHN